MTGMTAEQLQVTGGVEEIPAAGGEGRSWNVWMPAGTQFLSANQHPHWAKVRRVHDSYQEVMCGLIRNQIPHLDRVVVVLLYQSPPRRQKDRHPLAGPCILDGDNLQVALKWSIDACRYGGVIVNDTPRYVARSECRLLPGTHPRGLLRIVITEVLP